jgi:hypothetical protein
MLKLLVRDASGSPQCLQFWSSLRVDGIDVGCTYLLSVFSTACIKHAGSPKKPAATGMRGAGGGAVAGQDTRSFASYGAFDVNFGSVSEFSFVKAGEVDTIALIAPHEGVKLPTAALSAPVGAAPSLLDVIGVITSCFGRRDKYGRPFCKLSLLGGVHSMRVSASQVLMCAVSV